MNLIGPHIISGFNGTKVTKEVRQLIQKYNVAGFIFFKRNIESPKQVKGLIKNLQKLADKPLFFGVDQEGGSVFRLGDPFTQLPSMADVGDYYRRTKNLKTIKQLGQILGRELRAVGINWDYAPVVDVHSNPNNPVIGKRSFGPDPLVVTLCAEAIIKGLHAEGVLSCAKHFPGHGGTSQDSHFDLPVMKSAGRLLWKRDLIPYRKLIASRTLPCMMTAHVLYEDLDRTNCATLSKKILIGLLRKRMGYKGVIISDDFFMKAIFDRYKMHEALNLFFEASGDIALLCHDPEVQIETMEVLMESLKNNSSLQKELAESQKRICLLKKRFLKLVPPFPLRKIGCLEHKRIVEKVSLLTSPLFI